LNGDYSKIFIGGFAEGCSIALATYIKFQQRLGGVIAFNGIHCADIDWTDINLD
jgi:predicted esterase